MCVVLSCFSHVQLFATLWTVACQAPLSMKFSSKEYWNGLPCPPPEYLPDLGIESVSLMSASLAGGFFTGENSREKHLFILTSLSRVFRKHAVLLKTKNNVCVLVIGLIIPPLKIKI